MNEARPDQLARPGRPPNNEPFPKAGRQVGTAIINKDSVRRQAIVVSKNNGANGGRTMWLEGNYPLPTHVLGFSLS